jgi:hypothetical protein
MASTSQEQEVIVVPVNVNVRNSEDIENKVPLSNSQT